MRLFKHVQFVTSFYFYLFFNEQNLYKNVFLYIRCHSIINVNIILTYLLTAHHYNINKIYFPWNE